MLWHGNSSISFQQVLFQVIRHWALKTLPLDEILGQHQCCRCLITLLELCMLGAPKHTGSPALPQLSGLSGMCSADPLLSDCCSATLIALQHACDRALPQYWQQYAAYRLTQLQGPYQEPCSIASREALTWQGLVIICLWLLLTLTLNKCRRIFSDPPQLCT